MLLDDFFSMFLGLTATTREKVEDLTELLVQKGRMQRDEARKVAEEMAEKGKQEQETYSQKMQDVMEGMKSKFVTREDIERLESKVDELLKYHREKGEE